MEKAKNININRKRHGRVMKNTMFLVILLLAAAGSENSYAYPLGLFPGTKRYGNRNGDRESKL